MENAKDILKSKSIILNDLVSSVTQLCPTFCNPMDCSTPGFAVHHQLPVLTHSCPLRRWCQPTISSSVIPFSSHRQSFPASGSIPMSQFFPSGGQSIGVSASASVLPMHIQDWFPLGWTGWISLQSRGSQESFPTAQNQSRCVEMGVYPPPCLHLQELDCMKYFGDWVAPKKSNG